LFLHISRSSYLKCSLMNEFVVLALLITLYAGYFFRLSSLVCFTLDYTRCGTRAWTVETAVVSWPLRELLNCRHPELQRRSGAAGWRDEPRNTRRDSTQRDKIR
jgi:hypothetical protein